VPQRGKKGYASLKATCRVAFLKAIRATRPADLVTQPGSRALVNIVTNRLSTALAAQAQVDKAK
jgi:hypothetical protein